eukprot:7384560-Prymnesium_polylepis.1
MVHPCLEQWVGDGQAVEGPHCPRPASAVPGRVPVAPLPRAPATKINVNDDMIDRCGWARCHKCQMQVRECGMAPQHRACMPPPCVTRENDGNAIYPCTVVASL